MANCPKCSTVVGDDALFCPECGEALKSPVTSNSPGLMTVGGLETLDDSGTRSDRGTSTPTLEPGEKFAGRYEIGEIVGRGGMGVVYRAQDELANKEVALKLIRPERLAGENAIKRLISEGITARDIRHPNIVAVYDVGEADGQPFVSMEYLGGKSLRTWHREKVQQREDVPLRVAARIIAEILDGLKAAHDAGVIHRDLKPENIILVDEPRDKAAPLKILDFGIARAAGDALESGTGTGLGTPRYMAPEQITNADSAGPPADLYSVSVIFYELLVDVLPQGHWQPPSGGRSDVPQGIDALIEKGLSNRPANRPQSAKLYRQALVDAVNLTGPKPVKASRPNGPNESSLPVGKIAMWGGIGLGVIIFVAIIGALFSSDNGYAPIPCEGETGQAYDICMGFVDEEADPGDIRVGPGALPPPLPDYADLSGTWNDGLGTVYSMRVTRQGRFSGSGYSVDGVPLTLQGSFSGNNGTYTVEAPSMGLSLNGRLEWDRGCHISFQTFDPYGQSVVEQGQMHVNHAPGAPCP